MTYPRSSALGRNIYITLIFEVAEPKAHHSPFWKSLLLIKDNVLHNACVKIGGRQHTSLWLEKWLPSGPLPTAIEKDPPNWCAHYRVSQLTLDGRWNIKLLRSYLPTNVLEQIQLHLIFEDPHAPDSLMWCPDFKTDIKFSIASAYTFLSPTKLTLPKSPTLYETLKFLLI